MNNTEVKQLLEQFIELNEKNLDGHVDDLPNGLENLLEDYYGDDPVKQVKGFKISYEDGYGGEGKGDSYWRVYKITNKADKTDTYIKFTGWYASHHGHEYDGDDFDIVYPKEVVKIQWSKKP